MFGDLDHCLPSSALEDQRALQLALELSMLGLTSDSLSAMTSTGSFFSSGGGRSGSPLLDHSHHQPQHHHHAAGGLGSLFSSTSSLGSTGTHNLLMSPQEDSFRSAFGGLLPKKSQNMTECVPVPSSEHVAEIVGRQGMSLSN
jgi:RNA-binding protein MEX3